MSSRSKEKLETASETVRSNTQVVGSPFGRRIQRDTAEQWETLSRNQLDPQIREKGTMHGRMRFCCERFGIKLRHF